MVIIAGFPIDVATAIDPALDSEITEYPVEDGADVTDHVRDLPISLTIEGIVSDSPLIERTGDLPSADARAHLEKIRADKEPITVETPRRTYTSMVLERLSFPEDARTGEALNFRASFKEVVLKTNERTTVRVAIPSARKKVNRGHKSADQVATPRQAKTAVTALYPNEAI
jgi:hypothetical protein